MSDIRRHSSDDMDRDAELAEVIDPVAVVLRADGSVDTYGLVTVVDQRRYGIELTAAAARHFTEVWAELGPNLPDDFACHLTCTEADALAGLFRNCWMSDTADAVLAAHAAYDYVGDAHYIPAS
jgi:hypothetical protein